MEKYLGIAVAALVVIGLGVRACVAIRDRYRSNTIAGDADESRLWVVEKRLDEALELQLQGELEDAVRASSPALQQPLIDISTSSPLHHVHFDDSTKESSWTSFKRESRAQLSQMGKSLNLLVDNSSETENIAPERSEVGPIAEQEQHQQSPRRQLPLLDSEGALAERNVLVNAKQYTRILKRRYTRQLIEDYFRSQTSPRMRM